MNERPKKKTFSFGVDMSHRAVTDDFFYFGLGVPSSYFAQLLSLWALSAGEHRDKLPAKAKGNIL